MYEAELEAELEKLMSVLAESDLESEAERFAPAMKISRIKRIFRIVAIA